MTSRIAPSASRFSFSKPHWYSAVTVWIKNITVAGAFDFLFRAMLVILPFHVILSVFMEYKVGFGSFTLYKEAALAIMASCVIYSVFKKKIQLEITRLDWLIVAYVIWLIAVTFFFPKPLQHLVYGGRYDFEFFIAFLVVRFGVPLLSHRPFYYIRLLLISGTAALAIGIAVRWVFGEAILLHFGFSPNLSNWTFGGSIPIYHGIDQANVRRFQWIFDGPNPAGFFILFYLWILASYFRSAKKYYYLLSLWCIVLLGVLFFTYSRSALIGFAIGTLAVLILNVKIIWHKYRSVLLWVVPIVLVVGWLFYLKMGDTINQIVLRAGSSQGHFDRAITGIKRAEAKPLGSGLASAGPAYRFVTQPEEGVSLFSGENKIEEDYYIPESWFIQQLVEGGIIGFALFVAILGRLMILLARRDVFLFGSFVAMATMNLFLHSYESVYISLLLFLIVGLVTSYDTPRLRSRKS